jgi:hypothetical protein
MSNPFDDILKNEPEYEAHPAWSAFRRDMETRSRFAAALFGVREFTADGLRGAWYDFRNGWDAMSAEVRRYFAAEDAPAKSRSRSEGSAWLSRCAEAERTLRALVGAKSRDALADIPELAALAARLEAQNKLLIEFAHVINYLGCGTVSGVCPSCKASEILKQISAVT